MTLRLYTPFWCEENVWWLAQEPREGVVHAEVAFVSNRHRTVALWSQRAAATPDLPVVWDYHVVLATFGARGVEVHDLDSTLGAPVPASRWLDGTFRGDVAAAFAPRFRVMDAARYVEAFSSDRSHMRSPDGAWLAPPPPWEPVTNGPSNLLRLVDVEAPGLGDVIDLPTLRARWRGTASDVR